MRFRAIVQLSIVDSKYAQRVNPQKSVFVFKRCNNTSKLSFEFPDLVVFVKFIKMNLNISFFLLKKILDQIISFSRDMLNIEISLFGICLDFEIIMDLVTLNCVSFLHFL